MNNVEILAQVQRDWQKTRPDIDPSSMVTVLAIRRTALEEEKIAEKLFTKYDLNAATFGLLTTLRCSAPAEGITLTELAQFVLVTPASITNRVDRLEERGLVKRQAVPGDRRRWLVQLTSTGQELVDEIIPKYLENQRQLLSVLDDKEQQLLHFLLLKLLSSLTVANSD
ncbi:MarR family winged helix-turn-helix transcriptional regulator [Aerosakkonemataceae cyanobacterium BLCC-F154]|uniref:MarR family winged helix-turn-helix transcriptional regulator n=1 Tax=Floridaenema fluviatile BLCC-F154 TaxID=3153640 RepID=A0ABV4YC13_9CYAN